MLRCVARAFHAVFLEIEVGSVVINDIPSFRDDQMPYGGVKGSGTGHGGPRYAIEEMTELQLMVINRQGGMESQKNSRA